jgi:hypothetical protein
MIALGLDISNLDLSGGIRKLLREGGCNTIQDVLARTKCELIQKVGLNNNMMNKLERELEKIGCCIPVVGEFEPELVPEEFDFGLDNLEF